MRIVFLFILVFCYQSKPFCQLLKDEKVIHVLSADQGLIPIYRVRYDGKKKPQKWIQKVKDAGYNLLGVTASKEKLWTLFYSKIELEGNHILETPYLEKKMRYQNAFNSKTHSGLSYFIDGEELVLLVYIEQLDQFHSENCYACDESVISLDSNDDGVLDFKIYTKVKYRDKHKMEGDIEVYFNDGYIEEQDIVTNVKNLNGLFLYRLSVPSMGKYKPLKEKLKINFSYDFNFWGKEDKREDFNRYSINPFSAEFKFVGGKDGWEKFSSDWGGKTWWRAVDDLLHDDGIGIDIPSSLVSISKDKYRKRIDETTLPINLKTHPVFYKINKSDKNYFLYFTDDGGCYLVKESNNYPLANSYMNLMSRHSYYRKNHQVFGKYRRDLSKGKFIIYFSDIDFRYQMDDSGNVLLQNGEMLEYDLNVSKCYGPCDNDSYSTFFHDNGDVYEGEWKNGQRNGNGIYIGSGGKWKYIGGWLNGKKHGSGKSGSINELWKVFGYDYDEWDNGVKIERKISYDENCDCGIKSINNEGWLIKNSFETVKFNCGHQTDIKYENGKWKNYHAIGFDDVFDTYQELITHIVAQCKTSAACRN